VNELKDPYTELFTPKQLEEFSRNTNGRYAGIGMEIVKVGDYVTVNKVFPGSPAEQGGVLEGRAASTRSRCRTSCWGPSARRSPCSSCAWAWRSRSS
jgi:predicted metalloprotease with PDZ domain